MTRFELDWYNSKLKRHGLRLDAYTVNGEQRYRLADTKTGRKLYTATTSNQARALVEGILIGLARQS